MGTKVNFERARRRALKKPSDALKGSCWAHRVSGGQRPSMSAQVFTYVAPRKTPVEETIPRSKQKRRKRIAELDYDIQCLRLNIEATEKRLEKRRMELTRAVQKRKRISSSIAS